MNGPKRLFSPLSTCIWYNELIITRGLLKAGEDVHAIDERGRRPLEYATIIENLPMTLLVGEYIYYE